MSWKSIICQGHFYNVMHCLSIYHDTFCPRKSLFIGYVGTILLTQVLFIANLVIMLAIRGIAHLYITTFGHGEAMCCHIDITLYSSQCNHCILQAQKSIVDDATGNTGQRRVQHVIKSSFRYISQDTATHHQMALTIQYLQVL